MIDFFYMSLFEIHLSVHLMLSLVSSVIFGYLVLKHVKNKNFKHFCCLTIFTFLVFIREACIFIMLLYLGEHCLDSTFFDILIRLIILSFFIIFGVKNLKYIDKKLFYAIVIFFSVYAVPIRDVLMEILIYSIGLLISVLFLIFVIKFLIRNNVKWTGKEFYVFF